MNRRQHSVSLVELMVAMTIGLLILAAIFSVYLSSRDSFRTSDLVARMQENARIALQIVAEDLQATGYLGNTANPALIEGRRGGPGERPDIGSDCAERWYVDMAAMLVIGNNQVPALNGTSFAERCMNGSNYLAGTDVIALKRASSAPITSMAPHNNWLLIRTDPMRGAFFIGGGSEPSGFDPDISTAAGWYTCSMSPATTTMAAFPCCAGRSLAPALPCMTGRAIWCAASRTCRSSWASTPMATARSIPTWNPERRVSRASSPPGSGCWRVPTNRKPITTIRKTPMSTPTRAIRPTPHPTDSYRRRTATGDCC